MNAIVDKPRPAPVSPRVEHERQQRRRREDLGIERLRNLAIAGRKDPNYMYRWINDEPGRVHRLTELDDWDVVTTSDLGEAHAKDRTVGTGVERIVDKRTGTRAILVRKRKDYYRADKAKEQADVDANEAGIKRGLVNSPEALTGPAAYVPAGGISVTHGGKT